MDDPVDLALGIVTGTSLVLCAACMIGYFIREARKRRLKPSRSETNLMDVNVHADDPVIVHKRESDPNAIEF